MDETMSMLHNEEQPNRKKTKLPITILCGFLGAGKTTLLRHILQTQHDKKAKFRCAVIVNDMAALNIDKSLIEDSALVQSDDDLVEMQNGCVCCNLQSDLIGQIIKLAQKPFDYMIIEASGVSEPSHISKLFVNQEDCEKDHDHEQEHGPALGDVARLDTCVTVVDAHEFLANSGDRLRLANQGSTWNTAKLMAEQVEFSNVVILNKIDLVLPEQLEQMERRIQMLNPKAKIIQTSQAQPLDDVLQVVNTQLFHPKDFDFDSILQQEEWTPKQEAETNPKKSCCQSSQAQGKPACCASSTTTTVSKKSQILLGSSSTVSNEPPSKRTKLFTRHESRFSVTSFLYTARLPFHPERFREKFLKKYFVLVPDDQDDDDEDDHDSHSGSSARMQEKEEKKQEDKMEELQELLEELQVETAAKHTIRSEAFGGQLLRSKGFLWLANMHDLKMTFSQAGSMASIEDGVLWNVLKRGAWSSKNPNLQKRLRKSFQGTFADRRQELVFIGIGLQPSKIQMALDECLLTQEEYDMGVDGWKAMYGDSLLDATM